MQPPPTRRVQPEPAQAVQLSPREEAARDRGDYAP
jgi:hypothetical protein